MLLNRCGSLETVLSSFHAVLRAVTSCNRDGVFASVNIGCDPAHPSGKTAAAVYRLLLLLMIAFIQRCSPLLKRLTALACDSSFL